MHARLGEERRGRLLLDDAVAALDDLGEQRQLERVRLGERLAELRVLRVDDLLEREDAVGPERLREQVLGVRGGRGDQLVLEARRRVEVGRRGRRRCGHGGRVVATAAAVAAAELQRCARVNPVFSPTKKRATSLVDRDSQFANQ